MGHGPTSGTYHAAQAQTLEPPPSVPLCPRGPESLAVTRSGGDGSAVWGAWWRSRDRGWLLP